jgi:hypothetical protein
VKWGFFDSHTPESAKIHWNETTLWGVTNIMKRRLAEMVRLLTISVAFVLLCYVTFWCFLAYQVRRASRLFEAVHSVNIGDTEESVMPVLERYGGHRWDVQLGSREDYNYVVAINPWHRLTLFSGESDSKVRTIVSALNPRFRRAIGLRLWTVDSEVAIKDHRVVAVQAATAVEGRNMWLGAMWRFSEKPREFERNAASLISSSEETPCVVSPANLNMETGMGSAWNVWFTPSSPRALQQMAKQLNLSCMRSLSGCNSVCDLMPEAARYFKEHPDIAPAGGDWDDSLQSCVKRDPRYDSYW